MRRNTSIHGGRAGAWREGRVPWAGWLFLAGCAVLAAALRWDDVLWGLRSGQSTGLLHALAQGLSMSGNGGVLITLGAACSVGLAWRGSRSGARWMLALTLAGTLAGLSGTVLRSVIGRARPMAHVVQGWHGPRVGGHWVIGQHAYGAFPSGHASLAAGFGSFWFLRRRRAGMLGLTYAAAVAWSRVELGAHRPSDVVAGLLLGSTVTLLAGPSLMAAARKWLPDKPVDGGALPAST